jgi:hypothetical protein
MLGWSWYIHTGDEDLKGEEVRGKIGNNWSNSIVNPPEKINIVNSGKANTGVTDGGDAHEGNRDDDDENQAPSFLEYSDGEGEKDKVIVMSETEDEEEVDELNSSEYEGLSMAGMLINTDSGRYYEIDIDAMDMVDEVVPMDMDVGISEAAMDDGLPEEEMGPIELKTLKDEIPVEMEIDGETCLFSQAAIAELHLLRENARLRGEEIDKESEEFSEEREYGDLISTVVVQTALVAGPSQPWSGRTGGNSKCSILLYFLFDLENIFSWTRYQAHFRWFYFV